MKRARVDKLYPEWMNCSWRRVSCGKMSCPICGRIKRDRARHIMLNQDPDSMEAAMEDVGAIFDETLSMIKSHLQAEGIVLEEVDVKEPPGPEEFPLYLKIADWHEQIIKLYQRTAEQTAWLTTEAGLDLIWYAGTLCAKTYRQLSNRWQLDNWDDYGDADLIYTNLVLAECLNILKQALTELNRDYPNQQDFKLLYLLLTAHEPEILAI